MKYIFSIHSHITYLIAYTTIQHLKIPDESVILLASKYKVHSNQYRVEPSFEMRFNTPIKKIKTFNVPKSHDRMIDKIIGNEDFIAFIDLMSYYQKILVTHTKCKGFHFIEEGNSTYLEFDDLEDLTWPERSDSYRSKGIDKSLIRSFLRVLRGYNIKLLSVPYAYMAYANFENIKFYCFSRNSHYNAPIHKKVLLIPDKNDPNLRIMSKNIVLANQVIWIDGSNSRYTGLPEGVYNEALDKAVDILKSRGIIRDKVFVKLRSDQARDEVYLVKSLKERFIEVIFLPTDVVLEALFIVSSNCTVVGALTSALEYAHCFGHRSISFYSLFSQKRTTFLDRMKGFWENVEVI